MSTSSLSGDLTLEFSRLAPALHLVETEDSWKKIEGAITKLDALTKAGAYKHDSYIPLLKEHAAQAIVNALLSERTRLSGAATDYVTSAAPRLAHRFDMLVATFVPPLMLCCARTNKVAFARARKCLVLIARHCQLASLLPILRDGAGDKAATLRLVSMETLNALLQIWQQHKEPNSSVGLVERRVADIETMIRISATDRDPEVRQLSKQAFETFTEMWPDRVDECVLERADKAHGRDSNFGTGRL